MTPPPLAAPPPAAGDSTTARWLLPVFALLLLAGTLGRVVRRPMWHDEIFTLYVATRTGAEGLWNALSTGVDLNPPLYYVAVRGVAAVLGPGAVAARLPSALGFVVATLALYVFMRRRVDPWFAIVAPLVLPLTGALMYSWEGRAYGMVLGLSAVALAAWQARGEPGSHRLALVVCAAALSAAIFSHYYAVLVALPLAAGELARVVTRRRVDWPMWVTLIMATVAPMAVLRPLIAGARHFAATFWSAPALDKLTTFYRELLDPFPLMIVAAAGFMAAAAALRIRGVARTSPTLRAPQGEESARGLLPEEIVVALALTAVPIAGYLLALFTGAFHGRYVLSGVLGVAVLVAWGCATLVRTRRNAIILVAVLFLGFGARQAVNALGLVRGPLDPLAEHRTLLTLAADGSPVVVSHVLDFLPLAHYSGGGQSTQLVYLTGARADAGVGLTTADRAIRLLATYAPLPVRDYDGFTRDHERFYVYGRGSGLIPALLARGATLRLLGQSDTATLYAVHFDR